MTDPLTVETVLMWVGGLCFVSPVVAHAVAQPLVWWNGVTGGHAVRTRVRLSVISWVCEVETGIARLLVGVQTGIWSVETSVIDFVEECTGRYRVGWPQSDSQGLSGLCTMESPRGREEALPGSGSASSRRSRAGGVGVVGTVFVPALGDVVSGAIETIGDAVWSVTSSVLTQLLNLAEPLIDLVTELVNRTVIAFVDAIIDMFLLSMLSLLVIPAPSGNASIQNIYYLSFGAVVVFYVSGIAYRYLMNSLFVADRDVGSPFELLAEFCRLGLVIIVSGPVLELAIVVSNWFTVATFPAEYSLTQAGSALANIVGISGVFVGLILVYTFGTVVAVTGLLMYLALAVRNILTVNVYALLPLLVFVTGFRRGPLAYLRRLAQVLFSLTALLLFLGILFGIFLQVGLALSAWYVGGVETGEELSLGLSTDNEVVLEPGRQGDLTDKIETYPGTESVPADETPFFTEPPGDGPPGGSESGSGEETVSTQSGTPPSGENDPSELVNQILGVLFLLAPLWLISVVTFSVIVSYMLRMFTALNTRSLGSILSGSLTAGSALFAGSRARAEAQAVSQAQADTNVGIGEESESDEIAGYTTVDTGSSRRKKIRQVSGAQMEQIGKAIGSGWVQSRGRQLATSHARDTDEIAAPKPHTTGTTGVPNDIDERTRTTPELPVGHPLARARADAEKLGELPDYADLSRTASRHRLWMTDQFYRNSDTDTEGNWERIAGDVPTEQVAGESVSISFGGQRAPAPGVAETETSAVRGDMGPVDSGYVNDLPLEMETYRPTPAGVPSTPLGEAVAVSDRYSYEEVTASLQSVATETDYSYGELRTQTERLVAGGATVEQAVSEIRGRAANNALWESPNRGETLTGSAEELAMSPDTPVGTATETGGMSFETVTAHVEALAAQTQYSVGELRSELNTRVGAGSSVADAVEGLTQDARQGRLWRVAADSPAVPSGVAEMVGDQTTQVTPLAAAIAGSDNYSESGVTELIETTAADTEYTAAELRGQLSAEIARGASLDTAVETVTVGAQTGTLWAGTVERVQTRAAGPEPASEAPTEARETPLARATRNGAQSYRDVQARIESIAGDSQYTVAEVRTRANELVAGGANLGEAFETLSTQASEGRLWTPVEQGHGPAELSAMLDADIETPDQLAQSKRGETARQLHQELATTAQQTRYSYETLREQAVELVADGATPEQAVQTVRQQARTEALAGSQTVPQIASQLDVRADKLQAPAHQRVDWRYNDVKPLLDEETAEFVESHRTQIMTKNEHALDELYEAGVVRRQQTAEGDTELLTVPTRAEFKRTYAYQRATGHNHQQAATAAADTLVGDASPLTGSHDAVEFAVEKDTGIDPNVDVRGAVRRVSRPEPVEDRTGDAPIGTTTTFELSTEENIHVKDYDAIEQADGTYRRKLTEKLDAKHLAVSRFDDAVGTQTVPEITYDSTREQTLRHDPSGHSLTAVTEGTVTVEQTDNSWSSTRSDSETARSQSAGQTGSATGDEQTVRAEKDQLRQSFIDTHAMSAVVGDTDITHDTVTLTQDGEVLRTEFRTSETAVDQAIEANKEVIEQQAEALGLDVETSEVTEYAERLAQRLSRESLAGEPTQDGSQTRVEETVTRIMSQIAP